MGKTDAPPAILGHCIDCTHRKQEPLTINGKTDIAWFCSQFDIYCPATGYCWLWEKLIKL